MKNARLWSIMEIEDLPSQNKDFLYVVEKQLIEPIKQLKDKYKINVLEDEIDIQELPFLVWESEENSRWPLYLLHTTLEASWFDLLEYLPKHPIDIIVTDIKLHEYAGFDNDLDDDCKFILHQYTSSLNEYSQAFGGKKEDYNEYTRTNIQEFRECGGIVLFGHIRKLYNGDLNYQDPEAMIVIQTASEVINHFSTFEYSFPGSIAVIEKNKTPKEHYIGLFYKRIKQLLESGMINPNILSTCLTEIKKIKKDGDYTDTFKKPLSDSDRPWLFVTLVPWICMGILDSNYNKEKINDLLEPLENCLASFLWTEQLYEFFNGADSLLTRQFIHPNEPVEGKTPLIKQLKNGCLKKEIFRKYIIQNFPLFIIEALRKNSDSEIPIGLKSILGFFKRLEQLPEIIEDDLEREKLAEGYNPDDVAKTDSINNQNHLIALEGYKQHFLRPDRDPYSVINKILSHNTKDFDCQIIEESENCLGIKNNRWIRSSKAKRNCLEPIYIPWNALESFISDILNGFKNETKKLHLKLSVNRKKGFLEFLIHFPNTNPRFNIEEASFEGTGGFFSTIQSLKNWCEIWLSEGKYQRNVFMPSSEGLITMDTSIDGIQYCIKIPCRLKKN